MNPKDYYDYIEECIYKFASKADSLMDGFIDKEDYEDFIALSCLYTGFYHKPFPIDLNKVTTEKKKISKYRKEKGQFFTPPYIAKFIVENTIQPMINKILKDKRIKNKQKKILDLKICDPSMGAGIFLVIAHDYIFENVLALEENLTEKRIIELSKASLKCIYGVDIDEKVVELAKMSLNINHMKHSLIWKLEEYVNTAKHLLF